MNTGQMLLALLATVLLSTTVLTINKRIITTSNAIDNSKIELVAISVANSQLDRVRSCRFDENIPSVLANLSDNLTLDAGDVVDKDTLFDDVDDFNIYSNTNKPEIIKVDFDPLKRENGPRIQAFKVTTKVSYANISGNTVTKTASKTWNKLIEVSVRCNEIKYPINVSTVKSYLAL